jgi:acyl-coenzyme A synthetase/AMP-(fatty) acid ligase
MGYWGDPEATAAALRPDPLAAPGCPNPRPALFTGDLGYLDEQGFLYFCGRRDHQLKVLDVRVSPGEVEQLLYESGLVREAAVFGVKHDLLGDEVCAAVVPRDGGEGLVGKLNKFARATMSPFMMPRRYLIKSALPRTASGKPDYPALRREAGAGGTPGTPAT